jgi:hypothetical protein
MGILSDPAARPSADGAPDRQKERLMAEEKVETREMSWRQLLPWTELFRGFQVALDLNKLALAAAGILVMAFGWWLLALLFRSGASEAPPDWPGNYIARGNNDEGKAWQLFRQERDRWNLLHETAGLGKFDAPVDKYDLIESYDEYKRYSSVTADYHKSEDKYVEAVAAQQAAAAALEEARKNSAKPSEDPKVEEAVKKMEAAANRLEQQKLDNYVELFRKNNFSERKAAALASLERGGPITIKPFATLATWPWFENRGPNPYLMATGQLGKPWEIGRFWEWLLTQETPVLIEPVVKLLLPVVYFFSPGADIWCRLYFLCVLIWTVAAWSVFGGAITRIAAVQVARGEKIGLVEALRFTFKRIVSYLTAPLFPLLFIFVLLLVMVVFGFPFMIPILGDFIGGLLWPLMIVVGLLMAVALVGLVGWPLMSATISAEGTDSWEAVSRAYSYVYQKPWNFIWYTLVAIAYGAVVVFFVGFMGSLTVYLAKWGVSQTPGISYVHSDQRDVNGRKPDFLFIYAPTSFGWRPLLLQGATVDGVQVVESDGQINQAAYDKWIGREASDNKDEKGQMYEGPDRLAWWNIWGAALVAIWLWIAFLLILGFSYSYFWSASTIVYMLLRRDVDAAEMDEVYLEEDEGEGAFGGPLSSIPPPPATAIKPGTHGLTMVDAPSLRPTAPPSPAPIPPAPSPTAPPEPSLGPTLAPPGEDGGAPRPAEAGTAPTEPRP